MGRIQGPTKVLCQHFGVPTAAWADLKHCHILSDGEKLQGFDRVAILISGHILGATLSAHL
jgi:hypothetical protein